MKDFQRSKIYKWEAEYLHYITQGKFLKYNEIQEFIDKVWAETNLDKPPRLLKLSTALCKNYGGKAQRQNVWMPSKGQFKIVVLHELAHSMVMSWDNDPPSDSCHGPTWVGLYMDLLNRYLGINIFQLYWSATERKIKFDRYAKPRPEFYLQDDRLYA